MAQQAQPRSHGGARRFTEEAWTCGCAGETRRDGVSSSGASRCDPDLAVISSRASHGGGVGRGTRDRDGDDPDLPVGSKDGGDEALAPRARREHATHRRSPLEGQPNRARVVPAYVDRVGACGGPGAVGLEDCERHVHGVVPHLALHAGRLVRAEPDAVAEDLRRLRRVECAGVEAVESAERYPGAGEDRGTDLRHGHRAPVLREACPERAQRVERAQDDAAGRYSVYPSSTGNSTPVMCAASLPARKQTALATTPASTKVPPPVADRAA